MTVNLIESKLWQEQQDIVSRMIYRDDGTSNTFKTEVRVNAYDFQSYARVEVWSNLKWNYLYSIPYPEMMCIRSKVNPYGIINPSEKAAISFDQGALYAMALKLLNII